MVSIDSNAESGRLALVFELMDCNIYELIRDRTNYLPERLVKLYMFQLLKAVHQMHKHSIFHRDIKPENILVSNERLKVADYGSCRRMYANAPFTEYISTRWYRSPECLLSDGHYDERMDIWAVGCVMFEIVSLFPLFPGKNEVEQIEKIHSVLGTPDTNVIDRCRGSGLRHHRLVLRRINSIAVPVERVRRRARST